MVGDTAASSFPLLFLLQGVSLTNTGKSYSTALRVLRFFGGQRVGAAMAEIAPGIPFNFTHPYKTEA